MSIDWFLRKALFDADDPWRTLVISLAGIVAIWLLAWVVFCVFLYREYFVRRVFPEDADIAYLFGHVLALFATTGVGVWLYGQYFGPASYALAVIPPFLWIVFKILSAMTLRRQGEPAREAAAAAGR